MIELYNATTPFFDADKNDDPWFLLGLHVDGYLSDGFAERFITVTGDYERLVFTGENGESLERVAETPEGADELELEHVIVRATSLEFANFVLKTSRELSST